MVQKDSMLTKCVLKRFPNIYLETVKEIIDINCYIKGQKREDSIHKKHEKNTIQSSR